MRGVFVWRRITEVLLCVAIAGAWSPASAQGTTATLTGIVIDESGAHVPGAAITLLNVATDAKRETSSGPQGFFVLPSLPPGRYVLRAHLDGFGPIQMENIVLNLDDRVALRIQLKVAPVGAKVTVAADPHRVSTAPAVSTVVDRQFVENLPLNGRSFHSLLELTPGVVLVPTVGAGNTSSDRGQFSVNGQRANANYFTVDGVSANTGMSSGQAGSTGGAGLAGSGQLPGFTAFGSTSGLVMVDALQEFRIQTSGFAPEHGRTPGGQVSFRTRSGTNSFHGSFSDYFRHDAINARDWFVKNRGLEDPKMRQHIVGAALGGPIVKDRTYFFGAYEAFRVQQPRTGIIVVPSIELRRTASPAAKPFLNVAPLPNGPDLAPGRSEYAASWSDPLKSNTTNLRLDHRHNPTLSFFGRVNYAPSADSSRIGLLSYVQERHSKQTSLTLGSTWAPSARVIHDLRVSYSTGDAPFVLHSDDFGGAVPLSDEVRAPGYTPINSYFQVVFGGRTWRDGIGTAFQQRMTNVVDTLTVIGGRHEVKVGLDYRGVNPILGGRSIGGEQLFLNDNGTAPRYRIDATINERHTAAFNNWSVYAQDNWRITNRLTMLYGARWEYVPPPRATEGDDALTLENLHDPYGGQVHFATAGTSLWRARHGNVAGRLGGSYVLSERAGSELILRGGVGKFYDLGLGLVANAFVGYPFETSRIVSSPPLPLPLSAQTRPQLGSTPSSLLFVMDRDLEMPFTWQWHVSAERHIGRQTLTASYIGAEGRKLLKLDRYRIRLVEWPTTTTEVRVGRNGGYSDYRSLQVQFSRRLHKGLQSIVSYTLGRSRDTASSDVSIAVPAERLPPALDYGYSDFDVRHVLTAAVTWQLPGDSGNKLLKRMSSGWAVDLMLRARSGFPVNPSVDVPFPPDTQSVRPNVIPGQPFWISDATAPGGRVLNRAAFVAPPPETQGDLRRGSIRGAGVSQLDVALRRQFSLGGRVRLEARAEMFNVFNTAMFGPPLILLSSPNFGRTSQTLGVSLGGISSLYQMGGPRSTQLSFRITF